MCVYKDQPEISSRGKRQLHGAGKKQNGDPGKHSAPCSGRMANGEDSFIKSSTIISICKLILHCLCCVVLNDKTPRRSVIGIKGYVWSSEELESFQDPIPGSSPKKRKLCKMSAVDLEDEAAVKRVKSCRAGKDIIVDLQACNLNVTSH